MTAIYADVAAFSRACGVEMLDQPGWPAEDCIALALRLIDEEFDELEAAVAEQDMTETADAIGDLVYVLAGLGLRLGVARAYVNGAFVNPTTKPHWPMPGTVAAHVDTIGNRIARLHSAVHDRSLTDTDVQLHLGIFAAADMGIILGLPMRTCWDAIQSSNMQKVVDGKVIRNEAGKIQKPAGWAKPDIAGILEKAAA